MILVVPELFRPELKLLPKCCDCADDIIGIITEKTNFTNHY